MAPLPRIVFLDAETVDLGDLDLSPIRRFGRYRDYRLTPPQQLVRRCQGAEILITNKCLLGPAELRRLPRLKLICVAATGVNNIDLQAARRHRVVVTNVAGYSTTTVAEHTLMFLLALSHRLHEHHRSALTGGWQRSPSFAVLDYPFADVAGKNLGIVGYGSIGKKVARSVRPLAMKVLIAGMPGRKYPPLPRRLSLSQLLKKSDFVTIHCPLTEGTRNLFNRRNLRLMKKSAFLLNLARGPIVNEADVATALKKGWIAGYATDVLSKEPPPRTHPLLQPGVREKVLMTPHIAWASRESRQRLVDEIGMNIQAFLKGRRRNRVV